MRRVAPLALTLLASCAESPPDGSPPATTTSASSTSASDSAAPAEPWLQIGAGITTMSPLADGDAIELVLGPQGGWHLDVAARFGDVSPDGLVFAYRALDVESGADLGFAVQAVLTEGNVLHEEDGSFVRVGDRIVLDIEGASDVTGEELDIRIDAKAPSGDFSESVRVKVVDDVP